jgi:hypothetical protein
MNQQLKYVFELESSAKRFVTLSNKIEQNPLPPNRMIVDLTKPI